MSKKKLSEEFVKAIANDNHVEAEKKLKKILKNKVEKRTAKIIDELNIKE